MTRIGARLPPKPNYHVPLFHTSLGEDAIILARLAGLDLDEWQQNVLECSLRYKETGKFAAPDMTLIVPRQNGKGSIIEARELAGLFLLKEKVIMHSAHEHKTAKEGHRRLKHLIESTPELMEETLIFRNSGAETSVELRDGCRVLFVARSGGSGRGYTVDTLILDEAYNLPEDALEAMTPTQAAVKNPQIWFISSTGMDDSDVLRRKSDAGKAKLDGIGYFEWKADDDCDPNDRDQWYQANPALGIRLDEDYVAGESRTLSPVGFARERLGLWASMDIDSLIPATVWDNLAYKDWQIDDPAPGSSGPLRDRISFAVDIDPEGQTAAIYAAGQDRDGLYAIERVAFEDGIQWVPEYLKLLVEKNNPQSVALDVSGPCGALVPELQKLGIEYNAMNVNDVKSACGQFLAVVCDSKLRHRRAVDDPALKTAVQMGIKRTIGHQGAWAWARKDMQSNISPLVAATYALYAYTAFKEEPKRGGKVW
ncbi:terminase large subunit [Gordonia phage Trax]|uniref:Terminase large subunit n=1 Tax=Gordonia phage Trax TaxID=2591121 RepID=A0A515MGW3_9CAUD|nr:terminase large subunit [Gordonia phage Trax]QDM55899.1 terminase large subunit [Gordonia phage Trax]